VLSYLDEMPLAAEDYLTHLRVESARFREALAACDPAAPVPSCPEWTTADLLWHLAGVQWFWAQNVRQRPERVEESARPARPASYAETLAVFDEWSNDLQDALASAPPADEAWTWSQDQTVGFILRRQAHEALIHRVDAELAAGESSELPAQLAADGVLEVLDVMFGGCPPWGSWEPLQHYGRVDCTDTGDEFWIRFGLSNGTSPDGEVIADEQDFHVVPAPHDVEPEFVLDGPAGALDAWLWQRGDDSELSVAGDRVAYERFLGVVRHPID